MLYSKYPDEYRVPWDCPCLGAFPRLVLGQRRILSEAIFSIARRDLPCNLCVVPDFVNCVNILQSAYVYVIPMKSSANHRTVAEETDSSILLQEQTVRVFDISRIFVRSLAECKGFALTHDLDIIPLSLSPFREISEMMITKYCIFPKQGLQYTFSEIRVEKTYYLLILCFDE